MVSNATIGADDAGGAIGRRYGRSAAKDWQRLLARFEFGDGFALIVLLVPDRDGAALCRTELERVLPPRGLLVYAVAISAPPDLVRVAAELPSLTFGADVGAVWVEAAVAHSAPDLPQWESAWRRALEGLNQQRNPLRAALRCPVVLVGAPWILPLFREVAPDLWSVRGQVIRIEPEPDADQKRPPEAGRAERRRDNSPQVDAPDPAFALGVAQRLRGAPNREADLGLLLIRAGQGLLARNRPDEAEIVLREAADLVSGLQHSTALSVVLNELGRAILDQGRAAEAEALFRTAAVLAEEGGATATSRGIIAHGAGRAILDQGRAAEAEAMFRIALALAEEGGDTAISRGITREVLGRSILGQGRAAEAEAMVRSALALKEEGGDTSTSRGTTTDYLGRAILAQGRAPEAEAMFRTALALKQEGGDTATSRGITADMLGRAILDQGRAAEAEAMFRHALALAEEDGASGETIEQIRRDLDRAAKTRG